MPGCCRTNEQGGDRGEKDDWREPPGYLGEAVRRAKIIARALEQMRQGPTVN